MATPETPLLSGTTCPIGREPPKRAARRRIASIAIAQLAAVSIFLSTDALAQSPLDDRDERSSLSRGSSEDLWPAALSDKPSDVVDRDELRRLIREELRTSKEEGSDREGELDTERDSDKASRDEKKPSEEKDKPGALSSVWEHGFVAESKDKRFRIHFGGRFDWDNSWFDQDENLLTGGNPPVKLADGAAMRRARFRADGTVDEWIDFVTEVNFATIQDAANVSDQVVPIGSVGVTDFYLTFRHLPVVGNLRAGHFKAPASLERLTSANVWYYMERSSVFDAFFGPDQRQSGLMLFNSWCDDRITLASAFTRVGHDTLSNFAFDAEPGLYGSTTRVTALPVFADEGRLLAHFGASYFRHSVEDREVSFSNRLPLRAGGGSNQVPRILSTGTYYTPEDGNVLNVECAAVCGPLSVSAEYALAWVTDVFGQYDGTNFTDPRGNVHYHAGYVEAGCFLTRGDYRRFDKPNATWARTIPRRNVRMRRSCDGTGHCDRGCGAVQFVTRYSWLDLVSGDPTLTPNRGGARAGVQRDLTAGVNWHLNPQTIVSVNYVYTRVESIVAGASGDIQGIGTRLHFDF